MSGTTPNSDPKPHAADPLRSTLSDDPDMVELVEFFVDEMGERIDTIITAAAGNDLGQLRTVAHQLRGAAAGYGFEPISDSAATLERVIDASDPAAEVDSMREQVDDLIELCRRASL